MFRGRDAGAVRIGLAAGRAHPVWRAGDDEARAQARNGGRDDQPGRTHRARGSGRRPHARRNRQPSCVGARARLCPDGCPPIWRYTYVMSNAEVVSYKGIKYRRYPDSGKWAERSYYIPGIGDRQKYGLGRLHEEIWKDANGPIPEGCHIHHKDENPLNNDPANLVCLTDAEHREYHAEGWSEQGRTPGHLAHLEAIRPLTVAWHRSKEGRAWHRKHGAEAMAARELVTFACEQCGKSYETLNRGDGTRFCSNACKSAWRRAAGLDDIERTCHQCGNTFRASKYSKTAHCGRSCGRSCSWAGGCPGIQLVGGG
ncbi:MAG: HNH endonuclease signature motif containing protein [Streptosporangiaceae bacterium]